MAKITLPRYLLILLLPFCGFIAGIILLFLGKTQDCPPKHFSKKVDGKTNELTLRIVGVVLIVLFGLLTIFFAGLYYKDYINTAKKEMEIIKTQDKISEQQAILKNQQENLQN